MSKSNLNMTMRVFHRYLGFFLAGIMAVYSISGIVLIFRETEFLKSEKTVVKTRTAFCSLVLAILFGRHG